MRAILVAATVVVLACAAVLVDYGIQVQPTAAWVVPSVAPVAVSAQPVLVTTLPSCLAPGERATGRRAGLNRC